MQKYQFVEDYIEVISGYRDPITFKADAGNQFWFTFTPIISLARYDVAVMTSMNETVSASKPLTVRQGDLAVKMLLKYQRQLAQKGIDVTPLENPQWRLPLRIMDYTRRLFVQDNKLVLSFPFSNVLIEGIREYRKDSQGGGEWHRESKQWQFALTEYNLVWLKTWAEGNNFEIDPEIFRLDELITQVEAKGFAIELQFNDGVLDIINCPDSLRNYIETHCGGFGVDNLPKLLDMAPVLGYTVNDDLASAWMANYGVRTSNLTRLREVKIDNLIGATDNLASVLDYADLVQRWPVVVYEPDLTGKMLSRLIELRGSDVVSNTKHNVDDADRTVKYIHTIVPIRNMDTIPLLISTAGMMFGGDKSLMVQRTEKAVYCAPEVYTSKKEHKVPSLAG